MKFKRIIFLCSIFFINAVSSQMVSSKEKKHVVMHEKDIVKRMKLENDGANYLVVFSNLAAFYTVDKSQKTIISCLSESARKSRIIKVTVEAETGKILSCS